MAKYKKADNCGPVPYPDRSGRMLNSGDVAEGDDWEPLAMLGYVVRVVEEPVAEPKAEKKQAKRPVEEVVENTPIAAPVVEVATNTEIAVESAVEVAASLDEASDSVKGVSDVLQPVNDGTGAKEVDTSEARKPGDTGMSGRTSGRRRR